MNKTVTINISGIVFHIDETAYDKLKQYLSAIRSYFEHTEGKEEIMMDIESRIAEIFNTRFAKTRQVVLPADVDAMIEIMGKPEEFGAETEEQSTQEQSKSRENNQKEFRSSTGRSRRVFRDPDDKILGGVCSGLATYFNLDPLWFRLAFAGAFFLAGTGFLFYILLWIVIPEAKTTAEKLEMRGEPVNVSNIEKNIKEELESLKQRFNNFSNEGRETKNRYQPGVRGFFEKVIDLFITLVAYAGRAFLKIIGIAFIIIGGVFVGSIISIAFGGKGLITVNDWMAGQFTLDEILNKFFINTDQIMWAKISLVLLVGVPMLLLAYQGIRILFKVKHRQRWLGISTAILWVVGLVILIQVVADMKDEFRERGVKRQVVNLNIPPGNTLYLKSLAVNYDVWDEDDHRGRWHVEMEDNMEMKIYYPTINIEKSETDSFQLIIRKGAMARGQKIAGIRADQIGYSLEQRDSTLLLNPYFTVAADEKYRGQKVKLTLKVPQGKMVYLDPSAENIIYDIENITNTYDGDMINRRWIMGETGLRCVDCDGLYVDGKKERSSGRNQRDEEEEGF
jgi:phage shock protein PspC (stress-responsive transcriptional regulator)